MKNLGWRATARLNWAPAPSKLRAGYDHAGGCRGDWGHLVHAASAAKVSIPPEAQLPAALAPAVEVTTIQVANETTLQAARRLVRAGGRPVALNLVNGLVPGGGFLSGARAQEAVLCRSSALYETLVRDPLYAAHARRPRPDSTAWAIYSPDMSVFRSDDGTERAEPWLLSLMICAAPVAQHIGQPESS